MSKSKDTPTKEEKGTHDAFTWFGVIAGIVVLGYLVWTAILLVTLITGQYQYRSLWNGWMFGSGLAIWLLPIQRKDADVGKKYKCRRSWNWWFETISLFLLILFVTFINVSLYGVRIIGSTAESTLFFLAISLAFTAALLCVFVQVLHDAGFIISVYVFVMILAVDALPIPRGGAGTNILAGASVFTLLVLGVLLQKCATMMFRSVHEHILTGMTITFGALFLFDGYENWIDRSILDQKFAYLLIVIIAVGRIVWAILFAKLDGTKFIEAAMYKQVPTTEEPTANAEESETESLEGETGYLFDNESTTSGE